MESKSQGAAGADVRWGLRLRQARQLQASRDYEGALALLDELARERPADPLVRYRTGRALRALRRHPEAIEQFEHAIRLKPNYAGAYAGLAASLAQCHRVDEAEVALDHASQLGEKPAALAYARATIRTHQGRYDEAVEAVREYIQTGQEGARILSWLGGLLLRAQRPEEAEQEFRKAIRLDPQLEECRVGLTQALSALQRTPEAIPELIDYLKVSPGSSETLILLGSLLVGVQRREEARPYLERVVAMEPSNAGARDLLSMARGDDSLLKRDPQRFWSLIGWDPNWSEVQLLYALQLARAYKWDEALAVGRDAFERGPRVELTYALWGWLLVLCRTKGGIPSRDEVRETLEELVARFPRNPRLQHSIGSLDYQERRYQEAFDHFSRAAELAPESPKPLVAAFHSALRAGRICDCVRLMRAYVKLGLATRDKVGPVEIPNTSV